MVVQQSIAQPEHVGEAEAPRQQRFDLAPVEVRVAIGMEQTLFGGHEQAGAIGIDRPALEHPLLRRCRQAGGRRQPCADIFVARHLIFTAPAVEAEIDQSPRLAVQHGDRRGIAQPDVAQRLQDDRHAGRDQGPRGVGITLVRCDQPHLFAAPIGMECACKGGDLRPRGIECAGPFIRVGRKADPGPVVRCPFGRHTKSHAMSSLLGGKADP